MSLILEALRKSEAERQRGRAPGLFVEQVPGRSTVRPRAPAWAWGLGVLGLGVLVLLAWLAWRTQVPGNTADDQVIAAAAVPAVGEPPSAVTNPAPPAVVIPPAPMPAPADVRLPSVPAAAVAAPATSAPPTSAAVAPGPVASAATAPPIPDPLASRPDTAPLPVATAPTPAPASDEPAYPSLSALGAEQRSQLPALKLSMHVYAEQPAQRFVILDGQRLGEGASPANGVVLEQIRRDGLVLLVNGQRYLLARP